MNECGRNRVPQRLYRKNKKIERHKGVSFFILNVYTGFD